ncbi:ADP-ribosylation factor-like protein [Persephonella sp. IF05-L8]|uniref:ADP-ribosylation factor-like protein n=1 Tax=Persephonella sp. IF05-L8 TaxID=1158338 RepID=UPI0004956BCC
MIDKTFKILVAGHFGAGKTTFVKTISQIETVNTERKTSLKEEREKKETTTVAMDFGEYINEYGYKLRIFGIPGQERFSFMWPILARDTKGFVFLIDSTDTSRWFEIPKQLKILLKVSPSAPILFVANKVDLPGAMSAEEVRKKLKIPPHIKVVEGIATDKKIVERILNELTEEILKKNPELKEI